MDKEIEDYAFSNWAEIEIMPSMKATAVVTMLRKLFARHGVPEVINSDKGTAFTSEQMQTFLNINGVRFVFTAPYHSASNERAEGMVREVKEALKKQAGSDMQCTVSRFLLKQHSTPHFLNGKSPAELMMGRKLRSALHKLQPASMREPQEHLPGQ